MAWTFFAPRTWAKVNASSVVPEAKKFEFVMSSIERLKPPTTGTPDCLAKSAQALSVSVASTRATTWSAWIRVFASCSPTAGLDWSSFKITLTL